MVQFRNARSKRVLKLCGFAWLENTKSKKDVEGKMKSCGASVNVIRARADI